MKDKNMKIALLENVPTVPQGQEWTDDLHSKFSQISQNENITGQWEIPFVVGQQYNVHWHYDLNWEEFTVQMNKDYKPTDKGFTLRFNYTEDRNVQAYRTDKN